MPERGLELDGMVAIVTGSGRGIGRAIALKLAQEGANVVVHSTLSQDGTASAKLVAERINDEHGGGSAIYVTGDIREKATSQTLVKEALDQWGSVGILVNNAGVTRDGLAVRMSEEAWREVIDINLTGAFFATQAVLKPMIRQRDGAIVSISSIAAENGNPGQINYAAAKAGLNVMTITTAAEHASRGIRANIIAGGAIRTKMLLDLGEEKVGALTKKMPLTNNELLEPDKIADAVVFFASPSNRHISGQKLILDGGLLLPIYYE